MGFQNLKIVTEKENQQTICKLMGGGGQGCLSFHDWISHPFRETQLMSLLFLNLTTLSKAEFNYRLFESINRGRLGKSTEHQPACIEFNVLL